jgi:hypothetical protein
MNERKVLQRGVRGASRRAWQRALGPAAIGVAALALGWLSPRVASACYCVAPELESSIDSADVIFEGMTGSEPQEIERDIGLGLYGDVQTSRYDFEVLRYYKASGGAPLPPEVALHTPAQGPACGRTFDTSQVYLIYARVRDDGLLVDFRCSRTRSFDNAGEDLQLLGDGMAPEEGALGALAGLDDIDADQAALSDDARADIGIGGGCSQSNAGGGDFGSGGFGGGGLGAVALVGAGVCTVALRRRRRVAT